MTDLGAVRAAIVAALAGVPGAGAVHAYERYAARPEAFSQLYQDGTGGRVRGWFVRRVAGRGRRLPSGRVLRRADWQVTGYASLIDGEASELAFDALTDDMIHAVSDEPTLGGVVRGRPVDGRAGAELVAAEPVMFAGVMCHRAILALTTEHFEPATTAAMLPELADGAGLVGAVATRLAGVPGLAAVEGRPTWDPDDDPQAGPAAIVVPLRSAAAGRAETLQHRVVATETVGVIVTAPAGYGDGAGAAAAGGLETLRGRVCDRLHGWGAGAGGPVDFPCIYTGGAPVPAGPGWVAWQETFAPARLIEAVE